MNKDVVHFALIIANYLGVINASVMHQKDTDNARARELCLEYAERTQLMYDLDANLDSEWMYNKADELAWEIFSKL